jgi:oligopeptide transport system ATP-binding protein
MTSLMQATDLSVRFPVGGGIWRRRTLHAVRSVSFEIDEGETLAVIGESGCGKSTMIRAAIGLQPLSAGQVLWRGSDIERADRQRRRQFRRDIQMIFQDPVASLDPRMTVAASVAAPLAVQEPGIGRHARMQRVAAALERVGIAPELGTRYPHELSGGQCQRVAIARALILKPRLLVCDEPLAALDVSIQAQIVNLLLRLQREDGLALLFVSHNLPVMRRMSSRIMVMHLGQVVEAGPTSAVFAAPRHPYTRALIAAVPEPTPDGPAPRTLPGEMPSPLDTIAGCSFAGRCPLAIAACRQTPQNLDRRPGGHQAACLRALD